MTFQEQFKKAQEKLQQPIFIVKTNNPWAFIIEQDLRNQNFYNSNLYKNSLHNFSTILK